MKKKVRFMVTRSCTPGEREFYGMDTITFEVSGLMKAVALTAGDPNGSFAEVIDINDEWRAVEEV